MPDELALVVERRSPRTEWVLDHVLRWAGFRARLTDRRDAADLPHLAYGGDGPAGPRGVWIREDPGGRDWPDPQIGPRIEVDLVNAIGEILTDGVNADAGPDAHDEHDRLRYASSWAAGRWARWRPAGGPLDRDHRGLDRVRHGAAYAPSAGRMVGAPASASPTTSTSPIATHFCAR